MSRIQGRHSPERRCENRQSGGKRRTKRVLTGRTYEYRASVERESVQNSELASVLEKVFRGSVADLLRTLLSLNRIDPELHECIIKSLTESISAKENIAQV
jgi:predicted transcriptional regulator